MASTNITNIKNAFTLNNTLGGNVGNQTTNDPTKPLSSYELITSKIQTFTFIPRSNSNPTTTIKEEFGKIEVNKDTTSKFEIGTARTPIYYRAGWYSTITKNPQFPPNPQYKDKDTSYNIKDKTKDAGTYPNDESIANTLYQFLDDVFINFGEKMVSLDLNSDKSKLEFTFASQESALSNSNEENAGGPPGKTIASFTNSGDLARARFAWIEWFIKEYIKKIDERFTKNNFYSRKSEMFKTVIKGIPTSPLKIDIKPKIVLPFTPYGDTQLESGAPANAKFQIPLYFQNGLDNKKLWDNRERINDNLGTFEIPQGIKNLASGKSAKVLLEELKKLYGTEQRSVIDFRGELSLETFSLRCGSNFEIKSKVASPPNFENVEFITNESIPNEIRNNIKLIGNPIYVPDRFGNTADGTALPYFLSGASDYIERDIMGFLLQIINKSYPDSKAFKDIGYKDVSAWKYIETNWPKWVATLSAEEPGVGAQAGNNVFKSGVRQLISDQNNRINTYSLFVKSQNREFFDKYRKIVGAFATGMSNINSNKLEYSKSSEGISGITAFKNLINRNSPNEGYNDFKTFVEKGLDNKLVEVKFYDPNDTGKAEYSFCLPTSGNKIYSYGIFGSTIYNITVKCGNNLCRRNTR